MKNACIIWRKGSRLNCTGYNIQDKGIWITWTMWDMKLADISGTKRKPIWKPKLRILKLRVRLKLKGTCIQSSVTKSCYQDRPNTVINETGNLVTGSYRILARWRDYFTQLLNVHGVHDVRQTETHTAEPLVPEPSAFEVDLAIQKLKSHKSPGIDQIN